jgi:hypothetical protein
MVWSSYPTAKKDESELKHIVLILEWSASWKIPCD